MVPAAELLTLLACPACRSELEDLSACDRCGEAFDDEEGTPRLIPRQASRVVQFDFARANSEITPQSLGEIVRLPPRTGPLKEGPYHLDAAHAEVLRQLAAGSMVLEIGCGGGQMRRWVESEGHGYVGTDISRTRVQEWLQEFGGPDLLADAHFLPFRDGIFDAVYSVAVTEHLACPQLVAQEVARVLKRGGRYLGNCSFMEPWHDNSFYHMSPLGVLELLRQAGMRPVHVWPGAGYSGYHALMSMGNRATQKLTFLGDAIYGGYRLSNALRNRLRVARGRGVERPELDAARVAGAIDWIAVKDEHP